MSNNKNNNIIIIKFVAIQMILIAKVGYTIYVCS